MNHLHQWAQDNIRKAQQYMVNRGNTKFTPYQQGALVWLEGTNIRTFFPTAKLAPKRYGPFPITRVLSDVSYELKIPDTWRKRRMYNVFHANLLTPYKETELHDANFIKPPPDIINGEEEYEVEEVLEAKTRGRGRKLHYLVKWKGFPIGESSWEPADNLQHTPDTIKVFYHKYPTTEGSPLAPDVA